MKIIILIFFCVLPFAFADLRVGFYSSSCPRAEAIVHDVVQRLFNQDKSITAALLRMQFHDCFVRGCDASILIDPANNRSSEKNAGPNQTVRGYEIIDEIKKFLEEACPSTVSCADIITLATRDAVALAGGPAYNVHTGRKDGLVSDPSQVKLPGPELSLYGALQFFTAKGFSLAEMVTLLGGGHTVGAAHCSNFRDRLSSYKTNIDIPMDPFLAAKLVQICGTPNMPVKNDPIVPLDMNTPYAFDNQFFRQVLLIRGILHIDQQVTMDPFSFGLATRYAADDDSFKQSFANAMIKMTNLVGGEGEIRKNCRAYNSPS